MKGGNHPDDIPNVIWLFRYFRWLPVMEECIRDWRTAEGVLLRHPAVQEVAIVGMPHEKWGEAPHAFVVLRPGATATEAEIKQFARDRLAHFKAPQWVSFVEELPKTATGKIQKYVLRGGGVAIARQ